MAHQDYLYALRLQQELDGLENVSNLKKIVERINYDQNLFLQ